MSRLLMCIHIKVLALIKKGHISFLWFIHRRHREIFKYAQQNWCNNIASPLKQEVTGSIPRDSVIF